MDNRKATLQAWACKQLKAELELVSLDGDASFRRYFRLESDGKSYIAMDSPPEKESVVDFVETEKLFRSRGLKVPQIYFSDLERGFLLIEDFGDDVLYDVLNKDNAETLYQEALNSLVKIIETPKESIQDLPVFGKEKFAQELEWVTEWFFEKYLSLVFSSEEKKSLQVTYDLLINNALEQPQVLMHRDYHSRNLMHLPNNQIGVLDFQGAVIGPITYDLVSLVRDCYIDWPASQVASWQSKFYQILKSQNLIEVNEAQFVRWFDLMGMQRHIKAAFIFARKAIRDDDANYIQFMPRALNYVLEVSGKYDELTSFNQLLKTKIMPACQEKV